MTCPTLPTLRLRLRSALGLRGLVDEVDEAAEVDAGVVAEADLAGARGGVAVGARGWQRQVLQRARGQLRVPHPAVARHACHRQ